MYCPICKNVKLEKVVFNGAEVEYCPTCLGLWFEQDELKDAKDNKLPDFNWFDVDLWQDKSKMKISRTDKQCPACCPSCEVPMYAVEYGDSGITVDVCSVCKGTWLDRGEFKKLAEYIAEKGKKELAEHYIKNLAKEGVEVFLGPESFKDEVADFMAVLNILDYKFAAQHPIISEIILDRKSLV